MSDFRTFVDGLLAGHQSWLAAHGSPSGTEFLDHYVGDADHPDALLWRYEAWRATNGFTRVRPWNGSEGLGHVGVPDLPFPGYVVPWGTTTSAAGPTLDTELADGRTTTQLQAHFGGSGAAAIENLGAGVRNHWRAVVSFTFASELAGADVAIYSIRFWGFMKWAQQMRNRLLGIPVFAIPTIYDADGVPLSDLEYMDTANRWHTLWHGGASAATDVTSVVANNPFAATRSPLGQFRSQMGLPGEFLWFHRELLDTYDRWRARAGMPGRFRPPSLHFHPNTINGTVTVRLRVPGEGAPAQAPCRA